MAKHSTKLATWLLPLLLASGCGWKLTARESNQTDPSATPNAATLAPSFSLPGDDGVFVSLDDLLAAGKPAVVVFYRGHW